MINFKRYKRNLTHINVAYSKHLTCIYIGGGGAHFDIAFRLTTWLSGEIIIVDTRIDFYLNFSTLRLFG